jgi:glutathione S-transferase
MLLYDHPLSPYAMKVRIMLREKSIAFDATVPEGLGTGQDSGFSRHNPRLEVPALVVEGHTICDSTIILDFLEERFPKPALMPGDLFERANCRETEEVCDTLYEANNWGLVELRFFGRGADISDSLRKVAGEEIATLNRWLEGRLSGEGWLSGAQFGRGDIAAIPYVTTASMLGYPPAAGSPLEAWVKRTSARAAVALTLEEAEAAVAHMGQYKDYLDSGQMRRQYRDHRLEWMLRAGGMKILTDGLGQGTIRFTDLSYFAG